MRLGIDLGGTKIEGVALADDGTIVERRRVPTERARATSTSSRASPYWCRAAPARPRPSLDRHHAWGHVA